jgi:enamine deaminase RidA (YjgF/YER057c/UK114 family)
VDPNGPYRKETVSTSNAPDPLGCQPQAVKAGPFLFLSAQMATDYKNGLAPEARADANFPYYGSSIKKQVEYILKNVEAICQAAGTSAENLVRRRAIHSDLNELAEAEEVWREALGDRLPPTTIFATTEQPVVPGCTVEYDLIAFIPNG